MTPPGPKKIPIENRFWSKVDIRSENECWPWKGCKQSMGYGQVWLDYGMKLAHVVAFTLFHKREPAGCVLHSCDNPICVNPHHLKEGTQMDNVGDMYKKGRQGDCRHFGPHSKQRTRIIY